MSCDACGGAGHQCEADTAIDSAVREEREAIVQYLLERFSGGGKLGIALTAIKRGDHVTRR